MLQPHKPDTPATTLIRKSHVRRHRKQSELPPTHNNVVHNLPGRRTTTGAKKRQRVRSKRAKGRHVSTKPNQTMSTSSSSSYSSSSSSSPSSSPRERTLSPARTINDSRTLYARPQGQTTNDQTILEIPHSELKDETDTSKLNAFRSRLQKEEEYRKELRRATLLGLSAAKQARKQQQYQALIKAVSIGQEDSRFSYERGLLPGDLLFQFLAPKQPVDIETGHEKKPEGKKRPRSLSQSKSVAADRNSRKVNLRRLRMWVPDTIVYCGRDGPMWLYTHSDGYVYRSHSFDAASLIRRISTPKTPNKIVAVRKESVFIAVEKGNAVARARQTYTFDGNNARVINTRELDDIVTQMGSMNDDNVFTLQRYIKCHGPQAFLLRSFYQTGKKPYAWMISNRTHFTDPWDGQTNTRNKNGGNGEIEDGSGGGSTQIKNKLSSTALTKRFCTDIQTAGACTFTRLTGRAAHPTAELTNRIHQHLQRAIGRPIEILVCDFIRDVRGDLWFLQIKAFKFLVLHPPLLLSKHSRAVYLHSQGGHTDLDAPLVNFSTNNEGASQNSSGGRRNALRGGFDNSSSHSSSASVNNNEHQSFRSVENKRKQQLVHRMIRCRFCMLGHVADDLPFTMTRKMIDDTEKHVQSRVSMHRFTKIFGGRESVAYSSAKSSLYQPYHVCTLCYQLYQSEMKLKSAATQFALSLCTDAGTALTAAKVGEQMNNTGSRPLHEEEKRAHREHRQAQRHSSIQVMDKLFGATMGDLLSSVRADRFLESSLTLYRLIIVFHALHNLPEAILNDSSNSMKYTYFLRYVLNGHVVELDLDVDAATGREDGIVPVRALRLHYMFTSEQLQPNRKKENRTIDSFISSCENVKIQLMRCPAKNYKLRNSKSSSSSSSARIHSSNSEQQNAVVNRTTVPRWHAEKLGEARIPLNQFRSEYVNKHDVFAPMGLELGMCSLRATIGLEQTRTGVDSSIMANDSGLREVHSVFVPSSGFHTADPLPNDWFDTLREPMVVQTFSKPSKGDEFISMSELDLEADDGGGGGGGGGGNNGNSDTDYWYNKEDHYGVQSRNIPKCATSGISTHKQLPTWSVTMQLHSLHNITNAASLTGDLKDDELYCEYTLYGKHFKTNLVNLKLNGTEKLRPIAVLNHTANIHLCCFWESIQKYHDHYPTLQIDVYRNRSNSTTCKPVGTAYINLEELATQRSIDGTYDMICYDKTNLSIATHPPYLSASVFCLQLNKKSTPPTNDLGFGLHTVS